MRSGSLSILVGECPWALVQAALEKLRCGSDWGEALAGINEGLDGGASPHLTEVMGTCDHEGLVAFAE
jgi:hypothetical protein